MDKSLQTYIISLGQILRRRLAGHVLTLCLIYSGTVKLLSIVAVPFTFPPAVCEDSIFSPSSSLFVIVYLFDSSDPLGVK